MAQQLGKSVSFRQKLCFHLCSALPKNPNPKPFPLQGILSYLMMCWVGCCKAGQLAVCALQGRITGWACFETRGL